MKRYFGNLVEGDDEDYKKLSEIVCSIFEAYPPVFQPLSYSTYGCGVILSTTDYRIDVIAKKHAFEIFRGMVEITHDGYRERINLNRESSKEEILDDVFKAIERVIIKCL